MDEWEQRFVIKFLWLQEQGSKAICAHLRGALGDLAASLPIVNDGCVTSVKAIHPAKRETEPEDPS
jgi:hypothetical protein